MPPLEPQVGLGNLETYSQQRNNMLALLRTAIQDMTAAFEAAFPRVTGTFTLAAAATTVVPDAHVQANSIITPTAMNATAGTLQGSAKALYISARSVGASFTVATANATAAAGTETFSYTLVTPS